MLFGRKKQAKPQTDEEVLQDAFAAIGKKQTKRAVRKRRSGKWRRYLDKRIITALVIVFVIIIADAVRRENQEFYATVTQVGGMGQARLVKGGPIEPLQAGQKLEDGGEVLTGPNGQAALSFPDGSVVTLASDTRFRVHLLAYHRSGQWRSRSFSLLMGRMWARVSPKFGAASECKVHTPSLVAAVRGTRFTVSYDSSRYTTDIACSDGAINVAGFTGAQTQLGQNAVTTVGYGQGPARRAQIDRQTSNSFRQPTLYQEIKPDGRLKKFELNLTSVLDIPLSILGIGKCSWARGAADFARRTTALEALRVIHTQITGYPTYPDFVDPFTLRELQFRPEDAERVLSNFDGACIESYRKVGQSFVVVARARDKNRTPYKLTAYGAEPVR